MDLWFSEKHTKDVKFSIRVDKQIYSGQSYGRSASMGMMAQSELDQWRCAFIVAITLYTRFAIEGGLDQEIAYSLSDAYL